MKKQNEKFLFVVTNNVGKLMAANNVFLRFGIKVKQIKKDYPEIQKEKSIEIAKFTAIQACKEFNAPVVTEGVIRNTNLIWIFSIINLRSSRN